MADDDFSSFTILWIIYSCAHVSETPPATVADRQSIDNQCQKDVGLSKRFFFLVSFSSSLKGKSERMKWSESQPLSACAFANVLQMLSRWFVEQKPKSDECVTATEELSSSFHILCFVFGRLNEAKKAIKLQHKQQFDSIFQWAKETARVQTDRG